MNKNLGKQHQKFFNAFIKISVISTILIILLLAALYFFLVA
tara:strand:- start:554 stop:676 length:123 start_codon:yes stop_codon:yes gene_type:complete